MTKLPSIYHHTQIGYVVLVMLTVGLALIAGSAAISLRAMPPGPSRTAALSIACAVALMVLAAATIFSSLTIDVRGGKLYWHFTGNLIRGSVDLSDVTDVQPIKTPLAYGWGLRETPEGRLYNVSGLGAVRITTRDGRRCTLGTDEPDRLAAQITPLAR